MMLIRANDVHFPAVHILPQYGISPKFMFGYLQRLDWV